MLRLPTPALQSSCVFKACLSGLDVSSTQVRFLNIARELEIEAAKYLALAQSSTLYCMPQTRMIGAVTSKEMSDLYDEQMADPKGAARYIYDLIKSYSYRCPLCGHQKATTLDHYLPKSKFPAFAVNPINLVPSCRDCNTHKSTSSATTEGEQTFHPYFDDFSSDQWLFAKLKASMPPVIEFYAARPLGWTLERGERVETHLTKFKLHALFSANAAEELLNIACRLESLHAALGASGVRLHLAEEANSRYVARKNSWQTAMYQALEESVWFCEEGCLLLREQEDNESSTV